MKNNVRRNLSESNTEVQEKSPYSKYCTCKMFPRSEATYVRPKQITPKNNAERGNINCIITGKYISLHNGSEDVQYFNRTLAQ